MFILLIDGHAFAIRRRYSWSGVEVYPVLIKGRNDVAASDREHEASSSGYPNP